MKRTIRRIVEKILKLMNFEMVYTGSNFGAKDYCANDYARQAHLQMLQAFEALGFCVTNFFLNMGSDRGLVAIDFDCFMVSKNAVV